MLFDRPNSAADFESAKSGFTSRRKLVLAWAAIVLLISSSTAMMMLCPCDSVGLHDHYAITLVALAVVFAATAMFLLFRRMRRDSGITAFLRAVIAIAVVGVAVYAELFIAQEVVAWMARPR